MVLSTSRNVEDMSNRPDGERWQNAEAEKNAIAALIKSFKNKRLPFRVMIVRHKRRRLSREKRRSAEQKLRRSPNCGL